MAAQLDHNNAELISFAFRCIIVTVIITLGIGSRITPLLSFMHFLSALSLLEQSCVDLKDQRVAMRSSDGLLCLS